MKCPGEELTKRWVELVEAADQIVDTANKNWAAVVSLSPTGKNKNKNVSSQEKKNLTHT